jgi:hypothetical protein
VPIILIGNKADKGSNISRDHVMRDWVRTEKAVMYLETSALRCEGIEDAFI